MWKCLLTLGIAGLCAAQTSTQYRNSFANHDIVVLAKAGFSEEFILDAISGARTHFETTADDLAALAREGISETIIRAMMKPPAPAAARPVDPPAVPVETEKAAPARKAKEKEKAQPKPPKPTPVELAMSSRTPYFESSSSLFGLSKKQIGVGAAAGEDRKVEAQLGAIYQQVKVGHP